MKQHNFFHPLCTSEALDSPLKKAITFKIQNYRKIVSFLVYLNLIGPFILVLTKTNLAKSLALYARSMRWHIEGEGVIHEILLVIIREVISTTTVI